MLGRANRTIAGCCVVASGRGGTMLGATWVSLCEREGGALFGLLKVSQDILLTWEKIRRQRDKVACKKRKIRHLALFSRDRSLVKRIGTNGRKEARVLGLQSGNTAFV